MSRRDTIIIALLVNAGLLALLFMLAVNNDDDSVADQTEIISSIVEEGDKTPPHHRPAAPPVAERNLNDEVDSFLRELASEDSPQPIVIDDERFTEMRVDEPLPAAKPAERRETSREVTREAPREVKGFADQKYVEITVKRGDALEKIARSNGTTVEAIKKANQMSTAKLAVGQVLKVPVSTKTGGETAEASKPAQPAAQSLPKEPSKKPIAAVASDAQYYTIKSGDNPWKIAKQFNVKFEDLLRMNNLDEERARNLKIGDKVRVK